MVDKRSEAREEEKKAEAEVRSKVEAENKARQEEKSANESRANTGRGRHGTSRGFTMGVALPWVTWCLTTRVWLLPTPFLLQSPPTGRQRL